MPDFPLLAATTEGRIGPPHLPNRRGSSGAAVLCWSALAWLAGGQLRPAFGINRCAKKGRRAMNQGL